MANLQHQYMAIQSSMKLKFLKCVPGPFFMPLLSKSYGGPCEQALRYQRIENRYPLDGDLCNQIHLNFILLLVILVLRMSIHHQILIEIFLQNFFRPSSSLLIVAVRPSTISILVFLLKQEISSLIIQIRKMQEIQ